MKVARDLARGDVLLNGQVVTDVEHGEPGNWLSVDVDDDGEHRVLVIDADETVWLREDA